MKPIDVRHLDIFPREPPPPIVVTLLINSQPPPPPKDKKKLKIISRRRCHHSTKNRNLIFENFKHLGSVIKRSPFHVKDNEKNLILVEFL